MVDSTRFYVTDWSSAATNMITIKVTLTNGNNWTTGFNGSFADAEHYYLGTFFETSDELHAHECVRVEMINK